MTQVTMSLHVYRIYDYRMRKLRDIKSIKKNRLTCGWVDSIQENLVDDRSVTLIFKWKANPSDPIDSPSSLAFA